MNYDDIDKAILAIPAWKRFLICTVFKRRQWKVARAYSKVCCDHIYHGLDWDSIRKLERQRWAELYGLD